MAPPERDRKSLPEAPSAEDDGPSLVEAMATLERLANVVIQARSRADSQLPRDNGALPNAMTSLRYQSLIEQIPAVVFTAALGQGLQEIYVNPQITNLLGYSQEEWQASPVLWYDRLHPDDRNKLDAEFARGCLTGGPFKSECRFVARDGRVVWVHGEARLVSDARGSPLFLQGVAFDISETKRGEALLEAALREKEASLREKEVLLQEIHHRVKNNLQVTSSLLSLQEGRVEDESARHALQTSQARIRSIALVHELLYRSSDLSRIDLREYIRTLTGHILRSLGADAPRVHVELDLEEGSVPVDLAVPCGLILNEVVSNSIKHAFPAGRSGTLEIGLHRRAACWEILVKDDGVGLPAGFDLNRSTTLGLQLVRTLTGQLDGQLDIRSHGGTLVRITFRDAAAA